MSIDDLRDFVVQIVVVATDSVWPPYEPIMLGASLLPDGSAVAVGMTDEGNVWAAVKDSRGEQVITRLFERLQVTVGAQASVVVDHHQGVLNVRVNGHLLSDSNDARTVDTVLFIAGGHASAAPPTIGGTRVNVADGFNPGNMRGSLLSFESPLAESACSSAVAERATWLRERATFVDRQLTTRPKTLREQLGELAGASGSLRRRAQDVRDGHQEELGSVAVLLRALLLRPTTSATWNPLLVRLAAVLDAPLPVYYTPALTGLPGEPRIAPGFQLHLQPSRVSTTRETPAQQLGDLAGYLDVPLVRSATNPGRGEATIATVVHKLASSASAAHFDEAVAEILDVSRKALGPGGWEVLTVVVLGLADAVADLADFIVELHAATTEVT